MRTRTKGLIGQDGKVIVRDFYGDGHTVDLLINGLPSGETQTTVDTVTPNFRRLQKQGVVSNNHFRTVKETVTSVRGSRSKQVTAPPPYAANAVWKTTRNGNNIGLPSLDRTVALDVDSLIKEVTTSALARVDQASVEGIQILAELRQTLSTLRNPIQGLTAFLERSRRDFRSTSKDAANQHLQFIYGVMPFIRDVESILKTLQDKRSQRKTARAVKAISGVSSWTATYGDGQVTGPIIGTVLRTVEVRAGSLYTLDSEFGLSQWGLSISNLPKAAYDLMPYSFVVDWFFNLGNLIQALSPVTGVNRLAEWYTVKDTRILEHSLGSLTGVESGWSATGGGDRVKRVIVTTERFPVNLGEHVGLVFRPSLDVSNLLASLSLIVQKIPKDTKTGAVRTKRVSRFPSWVGGEYER